MSLIEAVLAVASKRLVTIQFTAPLVDAAKLLSEMNTALVVVCDPKGRVSGVVTKSDVVSRSAIARAAVVRPWSPTS